MIVGLTGGIGSGKTTVANYFSEFKNSAVYIADIEAKKLINSSKSIKSKITATFGEESYKNGLLNSSFIAGIVFNNKEKLTVLNGIVHPEVKKHFQNFVHLNNHKKYIIYENAILFETKSNEFCSLIISVFVPLEERILRVSLRDNCTRKEVLNRINNQWPENKKLLQSNYIIYNNTLETTKNQVNNIHNILTQKRTLI
jgi:dephospho-CoA kinase